MLKYLQKVFKVEGGGSIGRKVKCEVQWKTDFVTTE